MINIFKNATILFFSFLVSCASKPETPEKSVSNKKTNLSLAAKGLSKSSDLQIINSKSAKNMNCTKPKLNTNYKISELIENSNACVRKMDYVNVESWAKSIGELYPNEAWNNYYLSIVHENRKEWNKSKWHIDQALTKSPNLAVLYYQAARLDWQNKDYALCFKNLLKSLELDNNNADAHLFVGQIYFRDQDFANASKHFFSVLNLDSKNEIAIYGIAESRAQLQDYSGAVEMFDKLMNNQSTKIEYFVRRAEIIEKNLKNLDLALKSYQEIDDKYKRSIWKGNLDLDLKAKIDELTAERNKQKASLNKQNLEAEQATKGVKK